VSVILESGETLSADSVLVTVSLGVLKSKLITFEPPLPQWKQEAIDRLGFGQLNKVVMQFSSIFWEVRYFF
jgi:monoamine oxidase